MKVDSAGNSYLFNAIFTGADANIVKLDKNGNQLWSVKMIDPYTGLFYMPLFITVDDAQNVYGVTTELSYTGFELQATNGSFHMGPASYDSNQQLVAFKLDKNGNYLWSAKVGCTLLNISGIAYDKYKNLVYPIASYGGALYSDAGNLVSPADIFDTQVAFFWSIDGTSGASKAVANLYIGLAGTIAPLPNQLSYFTSNLYQYDTPGKYLQLDYNGNIIKTTNIGVSQLSQFQGTDVSQGYYYDTGLTSDFSIVGYHDFRDRIRKIDLYGNPVSEKDYDMFDTIQQQKVQVLSSTGIKEIDSKNVLFYGSNLNDYKTSFLGDSLAKYDFRLVFMDKNLNVINNIRCNSTSYLVINSLTYNKSDSSYYFLLSGNQANTIHIGSAVINVPTHDVNVNYSYLAKIKFNITLISDKQPAIVSMLFDQQSKSAIIDDTLATVTATAQSGIDISSLSPIFTLTDKTHFKNPLPPAIDFTKPWNVTLVNDQGVERNWIIKVIKTGNKNNIDTVSFPQQISYTRDTVNKVINILVDRTINLQNTGFATFEADKYATVSPDPSSIKNFAAPQKFSVTAENGDIAQWTISVTRKLSNANDILEIHLADQIDTAHINDINKLVTIRSQVLKTSIESLKLSDGATMIAPLSNNIDFSSPVIFEIQAENGDIANWQIKVNTLPFSGLDFIKAYPMPADNILNVSLDIAPQSPLVISVSSIYGEKLLAKTVDSGSSPAFSINVGNYLPGTYLLNVTVAGHIYSQKIIIRH
jgi:Secretion system C-terminal sorting domain